MPTPAEDHKPLLLKAGEAFFIPRSLLVSCVLAFVPEFCALFILEMP
jgi:hypothetical protein